MPFKQIWLAGLSSDVYKLKLCGAGGGGFILGFAQNIEAAKAVLNTVGFDIIELCE
jgi:mevalonate kinase